MSNKNENTQDNQPATSHWRSKRFIKFIALYVTMVLVSTVAIYWLEHSTFINALRTAFVAAIGKTVAANWVSGIFDV
ncbi:MAG: hypothetical protein AAFN77_13640 [Planctomycetota bacterium]